MSLINLSRVVFYTLLVCISSSQILNAQVTDLFHRTYTSKGELNSPTLLLVLHGDAPSRNPSYQYAIARKIANENSNVVAVGILRPGYTDEEGNKSAGERGDTTGDNYTMAVLNAINELSKRLKNEYSPSRIVLVGHSGGAAISANLMAVYANTYNNAVLISCPCDLHPWRKHMKKLQANSRIWDIAVDSLSPIEEVKRINGKSKVIMIHGDKDETVPFALAENYFNAVKRQSLNVKLVQLENQGHSVAFNPKVFEVVKGLIEK